MCFSISIIYLQSVVAFLPNQKPSHEGGTLTDLQNDFNTYEVHHNAGT